MSRTRFRINSQGLSLITVLISVMLLAIGLLGVASAFIRAVQNNGLAANITELMNAAQQTADTLLLLPDDQVPTGSGSAASLQIPFDYSLFDVNYDIVQVPAIPNTLQITVHARYNASLQEARGMDSTDDEITLVTYRFFR